MRVRWSEAIERNEACGAFQEPARVSQSMATDRRVEIWVNAVKQFFAREWNEKFFELYDDGQLYPVKIVNR